MKLSYIKNWLEVNSDDLDALRKIIKKYQERIQISITYMGSF